MTTPKLQTLDIRLYIPTSSATFYRSYWRSNRQYPSPPESQDDSLHHSSALASWEFITPTSQNTVLTADTISHLEPRITMESHTPSCSVPNTPIKSEDVSGETFPPTLHIPKNLSQELVASSPELRRWQQDLLILTEFNDNSTLHWRPSWFVQLEFASAFWTLQNPPNVVTELLPRKGRGRPVMTRRMRSPDDPPPMYIKSWEHWWRYCTLYGIPADFLSEQQVGFMRLGLPKSSKGELCGISLFPAHSSILPNPNLIVSGPTPYPLYPEPQPLNQGLYYLDRSVYRNLPRKFRMVNSDEVIIVHSSGALEVTQSELSYFHASQWTHYSGSGRYTDDVWYDADPDTINLKVQGIGRRWSYLPWTTEQEVSCRPMKLRLRMSIEPPQTAGSAGEKMTTKNVDFQVTTDICKLPKRTERAGKMKSQRECLGRESESLLSPMQYGDMGENWIKSENGAMKDGESGSGKVIKVKHGSV